MTVDHILLIGFGGPTKLEEVKPFLEIVAQGANISESRMREVLHHYEAVGGSSRYNDETFTLAKRLEAELRVRGIALPVLVGMRNWHPFLKDVIGRVKERNLKRGIGIILSSQRSYSSFERYLENIEDAKAAASAKDIRYEYLPSWHGHPLFIEAQSDGVDKAMQGIDPRERAASHILFSAHSIPTAMARGCGYAKEVEVSSCAVADLLGHASWGIAYQSKGARPGESWLEPDIKSAMGQLKAEGKRHVIVVPIGFLCENVEVLFDLDIEARREAEKTGIGFSRAATVGCHPKFVQMLAVLIQEKLC